LFLCILRKRTCDSTLSMSRTPRLSKAKLFLFRDWLDPAITSGTKYRIPSCNGLPTIQYLTVLGKHRHMIQRKTDQSLLTRGAFQTSVPLSNQANPSIRSRLPGIVSPSHSHRRTRRRVFCTLRISDHRHILLVIKVLDSDFARSQFLIRSGKKALRYAKFDGLKNTRQNVPPAMFLQAPFGG
jgi:hypothetical protein